ncbi:MAG: ferrochelatase [Bdellovibrionaceae bacterium]|nr:ferrochelatase [Pseudobdellovibrionaceae bacterium]
MAKRGVMICNIGTPNSSEVEDVAKYLVEFLSDGEVISIPNPIRHFLVRWWIVPRRKAFSAGNYKRIWTPEGSPLMVFTKRLKNALQAALGESAQVEIGMRYADPSIETAMKNFKAAGIEEITILPVYPQYARATTVSTFMKIDEVNLKHNFNFKIKKVDRFYDQPEFIAAFAETAQNFLKGKKADHYLMTYHGLPASQNRKMKPPEVAYRDQCLRTSELIAEKMGLQKSDYTTSFQSRLGPAKWIQPYTDGVLKELAQSGIKNLAVLCPSFVSDCLETIDEIGVEGKHIFEEAGGEKFHLVPCLNERVDYLVSFLQ